MGKRIKRGIFRASDRTLIHADLNATYNIIKKAIPKAFADGIEGYWVVPAKFKHQRDDNSQRWLLTWLTEIIT
ncbi:MAG: hypothetical protein QXZ12_03915 [Thermoplasmata archaeon]